MPAPMPDFCICTAANSAYIGLLLGLLHSVRENPEARDMSFCVLDVGLTERQIRLLRALGCDVVKPGWDVPNLPEALLPEWLKAMTSRAFLPKYFPGHEIYMWLDSDTWIQDWPQIEELARSAADGAIAIIREIDHGGVDMTVPGPNGPQRIRMSAAHLANNVFESYQLAFGQDVAERYGRQLPFNSGVFALRGDSPAWSLWASAYAFGLERIRDRLSRKIGQRERCVEQNSLTLAIDRGQISARAMPSKMNWQFTYGFPAYDPQQGAFVVPDSREKIGVVHLVDFKQFSTLPIRHTTDGVIRETPIHYLPHLARR